MSKIILRLFLLSAALSSAHFYWLLRYFLSTSYFVKHYTKRPTDTSYSHEHKELIIWATYVITTRLPWLDVCLIRSMTALTLFRLYGVPATLHIGIRHADANNESKVPEAHMWLTDEFGKVIVDAVSDISTYQELTKNTQQ